MNCNLRWMLPIGNKVVTSALMEDGWPWNHVEHHKW
jgi:hypothetical protein